MNKASEQTRRSKPSGQGQPTELPEKLERLWEDLLSRQPDRIWKAFASLGAPDQEAVLAHLHCMISETGWQPEQRASARAAIKAIESHTDQGK
jgi:hypothetical protein